MPKPLSRPRSRWAPASPAFSHRVRARVDVRVRGRLSNGLVVQRADRRRRLHHAVELPAQPDRRQGRVRARRRLHRRAQAVGGRAGQRVHPRRDHRRHRLPARRVQPRDRRSARWSARRSPRIPTSTWCRSPVPPAPGKRVAELAAAVGQAGRARARRQVAQRAPRRRRLRGGGRRRRRRRVRELGPDLHRARPACSCRGRGSPRSRSSPREAAEAYTVGDPFADGTTPRPADLGASSATGCAATSRRASTRAPRSSPVAPTRPTGSTPATSCKPTVFSNVTRDMTIAQEEIFGPVLVDHPVRHRGRSDRDRQRHRLRARRRGVGQRRAGQGRRPQDPRRPGARQRGRLRSAARRSVATSSRASAASTARTASRSSSR